MKFTENQIQALYSFTQKHYVEWYDLQTELVDHLANGIEKQCEDNPTITFEVALEKEFKKFGIFGFMDVVENRRNSLEKKYMQLIWTHFKKFFSIPKIIMSIGAFFLIYNALHTKLFGADTTWVFIILFGISVGAFLVLNFWRNMMDKSEKKWLFKDIIYGKSFVLISMSIPFNFLNGTVNLLDGTIQDFIFTLIFVSVVLIEYVVLFEIPSKAEKYLEETYPDYKFSKTM